jgi:hypothetical protein
MAPDINLIKKSLIKKMGKKRSEVDPEILDIFKKYQIELPGDIDANFLTNQELIKLYDEISNYEYRKSLGEGEDEEPWTSAEWWTLWLQTRLIFCLRSEATALCVAQMRFTKKSKDAD